MTQPPEDPPPYGQAPTPPYGQPAWTPPPAGQPTWNPQSGYPSGPGQPYGQPYGQTPYGMAPPSTGKATSALVLGIIGLLCCGFVVPSVVAIVLGHSAKKEIDASQGQLGGRSNAVAGFWLGIAGVVLGALLIAVVVAVFAIGGAVHSSFDENCTPISPNGTSSGLDCGFNS